MGYISLRVNRPSDVRYHSFGTERKRGAEQSDVDGICVVNLKTKSKHNSSMAAVVTRLTKTPTTVI